MKRYKVSTTCIFSNGSQFAYLNSKIVIYSISFRPELTDVWIKKIMRAKEYGHFIRVKESGWHHL